MLAHISEVQVVGEGVVRLRFADGLSGLADIRPLIAKGGVFTPLKDRALFDKVQVGTGGRWLEWPDEVELCADALREQIAAEVRKAS